MEFERSKYFLEEIRTDDDQTRTLIELQYRDVLVFVKGEEETQQVLAHYF